MSDIDTAKSHLAATDSDTERTACGAIVDPYLVGQSAEDIECERCRRTRRYREVAAEEGIEVEG